MRKIIILGIGLLAVSSHSAWADSAGAPPPPQPVVGVDIIPNPHNPNGALISPEQCQKALHSDLCDAFFGAAVYSGESVNPSDVVNTGANSTAKGAGSTTHFTGNTSGSIGTSQPVSEE